MSLKPSRLCKTVTGIALSGGGFTPRVYTSHATVDMYFMNTLHLHVGRVLSVVVVPSLYNDPFSNRHAACEVFA
jgi:hypothetical protein